MKNIIVLLLLLQAAVSAFCQDVTVQISATSGKKAISPYLYGRNNNYNSTFGTAASTTEITLLKEAGVRMARENGGNNATKYNWRKKLSSHPDWYNNVYDRNWDNVSTNVLTYTPAMQVMWAFQLIGKSASNKNNNFNDWGYNQSQWWSGCSQNLAGGGTVNTSGGSAALVNGNPDLYLMNWPADSTVAIINHWFGTGGLGLNKSNFRYWNMDNEPEIWSGTHDDVMPTQLAASAFVDKYIEVAKKARALYPGIKLCGPVTANEWQWYKWANETINVNGKYYSWIEYFLKRVSDEQKATGIRLLDVVDIHWYPGETADADVVQQYRVFFDKTYVYPGANGVKTINGGWDTSQTKEYIFQRINDWLTTYFGTNHGITLGLSEFGFSSSNVNVNAVSYASILGTFANNGVDYFTPWSWKTGMWEVLHLFSRYAKSNIVGSTSTLENTVSAYPTVNNSSDSMTVVLVNRDLTASHNVTINVSGFSVPNGTYNTLKLSSLPTTETFVSHTSNALVQGTVTVSGNALTMTLPALSTTAVLLKSTTSGVDDPKASVKRLHLYPNPVKNELQVDPGSLVAAGNVSIRIFDSAGKEIKTLNAAYDGSSSLKINTSCLKNGSYILKMNAENNQASGQFFVKR